VQVERPKLIASDVDGTLLDPLADLTDRTARVIARVLASGTPFVLVSGRPPRWITPVARLAGLDEGYAVCSNGAVIYDLGTDQVRSVHGLDPMLLHDVIHALQEVLPGIRVAAERASTAPLTIPPFVSEIGYRNPWGDEERSMASRAEVLGHPATKLLVRHPDLTSDEMAGAAHEVLEAEVDITFSTTHGLIELSAPGVTKAFGLAEVCQRLGIDVGGVVAFGDMPNDVEMLRWAGHGVAMANAHPRAIAAADETAAPNSEDGVAQVLERWF
jgi:Cof subfamily protein (haloacid dehalogenase superfamily)